MYSSIRKYRIVIIIPVLTILYIIFQNAHFVQGLTEEQLREVEKLRSELSDAFDKDEEMNLAQRGVIVQPGWTQSGRFEPKVDAKVVVTNQGIQEAKHIRDEITKAVKNDVYMVSLAHKTGEETKSVHKLEQSLNSRGRNTMDTMLSSAQNQHESVPDDAEIVGGALGEGDATGEAAPNLVEAHASADYGIDIRKLQSLELSKRRTKEMLILKSIEEDHNFDLGDDVLEWAFIEHDGQNYFIGRRVQDLLIVRQEDLKYEKGHVVEIGYPITYLETYSFWNLQQQKQEGIIILASRDNVLWYRGNNETRQIELYWDWSTGRVISGLTYFKIDSHDYLAVSSNESSRTGYYALNIYHFDLKAQEFWIAQRLQLQFPCQEVTILDTGRDIVLAVAQNNTAAVYTFNPRATSTDQVRFQLHSNIPSEDIEYITAFKMGGRSYLALGGMQPQILQYQQGEFVPKTIFGQNFGLVELFFPIPVRTYRDDLILLIQHRIDFGTHRLTQLEALIWNGESFETSIPVPCQLGSHTFYGVNCLLDIQRDAGLKGAALLKRGDETSIIVPRHEAESGLFRFHTELLARNSEVKDLQEIYAFLQDWVKEQDELIAQAQAFLEQSEAAEAGEMPNLNDLELLETLELEFNGAIGELYVNDYRWTQEDTDMELDLLLQSVEELGRELLNVRFRRDLVGSEKGLKTLNLDEVEVDELIVDLVNDAKFYIQDGVLDFDGILNMRHLEVQKGIQNFNIDGNMEFDKINGIPWETIKQGLILRNNPLMLDSLEVAGEVIIEDHLSIETLNSLKFPEDYLWSSGPKASVVKAEKTFLGNLVANAVDTGGIINGVNPFDAITLSDQQDWLGTTTFTKLKVTETFHLNGTARGRGLEDFEINPTLLESKTITAACNFAQLEVQGPVYLNDSFEKHKLAELLADVLQRPSSPEKPIDIPTNKSFDADVTFPIDLRIRENKVNDIPIGEFVTIHTSQELNLTQLEGYVYFHNLTINGTYDGVDIEELLQNAIKIDEPSVSNGTQLNFVHPITAERFEVERSLNRVPIAEGYQTLMENLNANELDAVDLNTKIADIRTDIQGNGRLNGLNLREFLERRTWSEPSDAGNVFLDELTLENEFVIDHLHGIKADFLLSFLDKIDEIPEMILDGKIQVDHVIVTGDVQVHKLNGLNFDEDIQLTAIWLNRQNYLSTNLQFLDPLVIRSDLYCEGTLNGNDLPDTIDDMIFRQSNQTVIIDAPKNFLRNVVVTGNMQMDAVNGLPFERMATKRHGVHLNGTMQVNGNLHVGEITVAGHFNDFPLESLKSLVRFDSALRSYVLVGNVTLPQPMKLQDLSVDRNLNSHTSIGEFFRNIVFKDQVCLLKGSNTFTGRVSFEQGAYIRKLNELNLMSLFNNVVYLRETQPIRIKSPIEFRAPARAVDVTVKESLDTTNLSGCPLRAWLNDTLRVDRHENVNELLRFGPGVLDGNSFFAGFWNDVNLSKIITLHTPQNLSSALLFSELYLEGELDVKGPINDIDLKHEYENTLMKNRGDQRISTPLTLPSCRVLKTLKTLVPVNGGKDLRKMALLKEPLELRSPLFFQNLTVKNLHTKDLVSGINLDTWRENALWLNGRPQQRITGNWTTRKLNVMTDLANDVLMPELMRTARGGGRAIENKQKKSKTSRMGFIKQLEEIKGLELQLETQSKVGRIFPIAADSKRYLFLNANCDTKVYSWNRRAQRFINVKTFQTGVIEQIIGVPTSEEKTTLRVIINVDAAINCTANGMNIWSLGENAATLVKSFDDKVGHIYKTPTTPPHIFYALNEKHTTVQVLSAFDGAQMYNWSLPIEIIGNISAYRFLPTLALNSSIQLANGQYILMLKPASTTERQLIPVTSKHFPTRELLRPTESILKPGANATQLTFVEFEHIVGRLLVDLKYRLSLEVNITQLSIPESDLYDEHLVQNFITAMQALQQQKLFPPETFAAVKLSALEIPGNPAQVLAVRTVQILWSVIVEIEEIQRRLGENAAQAQSVRDNIDGRLVDVIEDVLAVAYNETAHRNGDYTQQLSNVIKRIRELQHAMGQIASDLKADVDDKLEIVTKPMNSNETIAVPGKTTATILSSNGTSSILIAPGNHIPGRHSGEVLSFPVGASFKPLTLTAICSWIDKHNDGIKLYTDYVKPELFQSIAANKPRSLAALRIRNVTLLAFLEDCCVLRVLNYRGVQGFVEFVKFKLNESVESLVGIKLPGVALLDQRYFFALSTGKRIKFYEVIMMGSKG